MLGAIKWMGLVTYADSSSFSVANDFEKSGRQILWKKDTK